MTVHPFPIAQSQQRKSRRRWLIAMLASVGLAAIAWASFMQPSVRIIYNPSDSVPMGWYQIQVFDAAQTVLPVGSTVLVQLPADLASFAAQRGYLPAHILLLKRVGAVAPQHVCIEGDQVRINGVAVATVLKADRLDRPLTAWQSCRVLRENEIFLLSNTNPASFDSRYFGPVSASSVLGIAQPIWIKGVP